MPILYFLELMNNSDDMIGRTKNLEMLMNDTSANVWDPLGVNT
jgi:hypothetical protein